MMYAYECVCGICYVCVHVWCMLRVCGVCYVCVCLCVWRVLYVCVIRN